MISIWISSTAGAVVVLSTDFSGRPVSGTTACNITWTENGLSAATSLTPVDPGDTPLSLFDSTAAQEHFAPIRNLEKQGPWSASIPMTVTGGPISLEGVDIVTSKCTLLRKLQESVNGCSMGERGTG